MSRILYKYRDWNKEEHRRMLTHREVYFASYISFNDPFDCRIPWRYDLLTDQEFKEVMKPTAAQYYKDLSETELDKRLDIDLPLLRAGYDQRMSENQKDMENHGILGLCENDRSLLMWAHYASAHKGFCVGFHEEVLNKYWEHIAEVNENMTVFDLAVEYMTTYPILKPLRTITAEEFANAIFKHKSPEWAYEKEHRFILFERSSVALVLPEDAFAEIIMGCRMEEEHKQVIKAIIGSWAYPVQLKQARASKESYSLEYEEVILD